MKIQKFEIDDWPHARLKHARERFKELHEYIDAHKPMITTTEKTGYPGERMVLKVEKVQEPDLLEVAILVGEILNAARGALDSVIWKIQKKHSPHFKEIEWRIDFPIHDTEEKLTKKLLSRSKQNGLLGLPEAVGERIKNTQQFDKPKTERPFYILQKLNNQDKHRSAVEMKALTVDEGIEVNGLVDPVTNWKYIQQWIKESSHPLEGQDVVEGAEFFRGVVPSYVTKIQNHSDRFPVDFYLTHPSLNRLPLFPILERILDHTEKSIAHISKGKLLELHALEVPLARTSFHR